MDQRGDNNADIEDLCAVDTGHKGKHHECHGKAELDTELGTVTLPKFPRRRPEGRGERRGRHAGSVLSRMMTDGQTDKQTKDGQAAHLNISRVMMVRVSPMRESPTPMMEISSRANLTSSLGLSPPIRERMS